jgi:hypothetical protein
LNTNLALVNDWIDSDSIVVFQVRATIWEMAAAFLSVLIVSALAGDEGSPEECVEGIG